MVGRNKSGIVLNQSQEKFQAFKGNHYPGLEKFFFCIEYFDTHTCCLCISYKYLILSEKGTDPPPIIDT